MKLLRVIFVIGLALGACEPQDKPPNHPPGVKVGPPAECTPMTTLRAEAEKGSLRAAFVHFSNATPCDAHEGAIVIARVLIDLAHYEDALKALERTSGPDVEALRTEIAERRAIRSPDAIAASAVEFKAGLAARDPKEAEAKFLHAWSLDAPNGQALFHAAMRASEHTHVYDVDRGATPEEKAERLRVLRLLERAEAELAIETGLSAHAGVAAPPVCTGRASNDLKVSFLADSTHGAIECNDGTAIFEIDPMNVTRVAQWEKTTPLSLDRTRLPRLRWSKGDVASGFLPSLAHALDAHPTPVPTMKGETLVNVRMLRDGSTAFAVVVGNDEKPRRLVLFSGGKELARVPEGYDLHELDDGRIAVRTTTGVILSDRSWQKQTTIVGDGADVSPDGKLVVFTKLSATTETYQPIYPWLRRATPPDVDLRPLITPVTGLAPASIEWARVGPVKVVGHRNLGTMGDPSGAWPAVTIGGKTYGAMDEVACTASGSETSPKDVFCMDPAGPVDAANPWSGELVCRIGPHVLPLGACPSLVKAK
ncbi:hypothetical protein BH09MYX1_BH09MYX1_19630 [soil metagenome]